MNIEISPATYLNELFQVICDFNVDIILGDFNDIILGNFNIDAFDPQTAITEDKLYTYDMVVNKPTHLSGSLLDQVHLLKRSAIEFIMYTFHIMMQSKFTFSEEVSTWSISLMPFVLSIEFRTVVVDLR